MAAFNAFFYFTEGIMKKILHGVGFLSAIFVTQSVFAVYTNEFEIPCVVTNDGSNWNCPFVGRFESNALSHLRITQANQMGGFTLSSASCEYSGNDIRCYNGTKLNMFSGASPWGYGGNTNWNQAKTRNNNTYINFYGQWRYRPNTYPNEITEVSGGRNVYCIGGAWRSSDGLKFICKGMPSPQQAQAAYKKEHHGRNFNTGQKSSNNSTW